MLERERIVFEPKLLFIYTYINCKGVSLWYFTHAYIVFDQINPLY
jgi:hypothetical protein